MSTTSTESDHDENLNKKKKYSHAKKKFQSSWLENEKYKNWLRNIPDNTFKCRCFVCNVELVCGTSELNRHADSKKHIKIMKSYKSTPKISQFARVKEDSNFTEKVKCLEIGLCAFFAEHNVALSIVDHLVPVLKKFIVDSEIVKAMTLGRTKCTSIVKNALGKVASENIINDLKDHKYSIMIDESTDVADKKMLYLLVRYKTIDCSKVNTNLLELIEVNAKDCSAESLYNEVKLCLSSKGTPLDNLVGVSSDGASVMVGKKNSVFSRLQSDLPNIIKLQCICHSSALVASKACQELPKSPEGLLRNISTYVSGSSKRCAVLVEFQEFFNLEKHKILKLENTRWLSMLPCVDRILENWDALKEFFRIAVFEDNLDTANNIFDEMKNPLNKVYLHFLSYVLQYFNAFNALFQSREILIHQLYERSSSILTRLCSNFILPEKIYQCQELNFENPRNYKDLSKINLGHKANECLVELTEEFKYQVRTTCLKFYIVAATQIKSRLPFNSLFEQFKFLTPTYALNLEQRDQRIINLQNVSSQFSTPENYAKIDMQWQILPVAFTPDKKEDLIKLKIEDFWHEIALAKDFDGNKLFFELSTLVNAVLILPHSNAEAERIFSMVTDCKTKKRNRLATDTLNAMTVFRSYLQNKSLECSTFNVTKEHIALHNNTNLYLN